EEVRTLLPNAQFEDATDVVGLARWVKSDEELACLRRVVAIGEAGIATFANLARPGADGDALHGAVMDRMRSLGSDEPLFALEIAARGQPPGGRVTKPPIGRVLEAGDYIAAQTEAPWGAQSTQEEQHLVLGPIPEPLRRAADVLAEMFEATRALLRPGVTVGELIACTTEFAAARRLDSKLETRPMLKGGGFGEDGPRVSPSSTLDRLPLALRNLTFERGAVVVWKPDVSVKDLDRTVAWGGSVIVTERGGEVVGQRPLALLSVS
ncbi:MAG TPA: M24 family metallopeptidase, partial [Chloroflexota bacterium]|nr:M24 family metallopeptidase [Chloroflexota bacterium]